MMLCTIQLQSNAQQASYKFQHYSIDNGLSQNLIYSITQDARGFMWFGTKDGLNRFDGYSFKTYRYDPFDTTTLSGNTITTLFTDKTGRLWVGTSESGLNLYDSRQEHFIHIDLDKSGKANTQYINHITEDGGGNIWVATYGNGLYKLSYHGESKHPANFSVLHYLHQANNKESINSDFVLGVLADSHQNLWVSTNSGRIQKAELTAEKMVFKSLSYQLVATTQKITDQEIGFEVPKRPTFDNSGLINLSGNSQYEDENGNLWLGTTGGLLMLDRLKERILFYRMEGAGNSDGHILSIQRGPSVNGKSGEDLWLGMYNGVGVFNIANRTLRFIKNDPLQINSLQQGRILCIYHDKAGGMWMGSNGYGLSKYDPHSNKFPYPLYISNDKRLNSRSLSVRAFYKFPGDKTLLIGANEGLFIANTATNHLSKISDTSITAVFAIIGADAGKAWIAHNNGLTLLDVKTGFTQSYYPHYLKTYKEDSRIFKILKENNNTLWLLNAYSVIRFDVPNKLFTFYKFSADVENRFSEPAYGDILQDKKGNLWLGTPGGLVYFDTTNHKFLRYTNQPRDATSLSFNVVRSLLADPVQPEKYLWIGTAGGGLNRLDLKEKKFIHFTDKEGLPNNVVYGILADKTGKLWLSTNKGISKFDPATYSFHNYEKNAGLQSNEFNSNAYYRSDDGNMYFGGINGFNSFHPEKIENNNHVPSIVFTDFRILNKSIIPHDETGLLQNSISETKSVTLAYNQNNISFEVAALDFTESDKNEYAYQLENYSNKWIPLGTERIITLSNLDPGRYILHVKGANNDGVWNEAGAAFTVIVKSPWWKTWWAYILYFLLSASILYYLWRYNNKRIELKNRLEFESLHSKKLTELDHLKSRFFANISHEFRTPLTLIIGPVEDLLEKKEAQSFRDDLLYVHRNSNRLLQLINQLLDLSKLDVGNYRIDTNREDIIPYVNQVVAYFSSLAQRKNILLKTQVDPLLRNALENQSYSFYFDEDIFEKIITNLLSNAFKFTPEGGSITVGIYLAEDNQLELRIEDTGTGIPEDKLLLIFDRFYQVDSSQKKQNQGTGIGLALVKELVELHQGKITVKSSVNHRTTFSCRFPFNNKITSTQSAASGAIAASHSILFEEDRDSENESIIDTAKRTVLVVEDQQDVRKYICSKLSDKYAMIEAKNGREGFELAKLHIPDLVACDVMMPEMDGFELCRSLKTNDLTSHIPVILLTARAEDADKLAGLETGADAYLIKPFNSKELLLRVHNLIELRNKLRKRFSGKLLIKPNEITVTSQDSRFMQRLQETIEKHMDDENFSVEALGREFGMSTSQINRKLKAIINQSASGVIRSVRMERAMDLLKNDKATIAEIAYETGFREPSYFSRVFKDYFGISPSEVNK